MVRQRCIRHGWRAENGVVAEVDQNCLTQQSSSILPDACLIDLLDAEEDIPILAPVIQREIICRLLVGDQGARLRQIAAAGSQSRQIARAIEWLKGNFTEPVIIEHLKALPIDRFLARTLRRAVGGRGAVA